jgi:hypothetical protein
MKPFVDALTGIAPEQKERLYRIRDAYIRRDEAETAAQAGPLFERAFRGTLTFEQVADAFAEGQIGKNTAKELRAQIAQTKAGKGSKFLIQDKRYTDAASALQGLFKNNMGQYFNPVTNALAQVSVWQLQRDWVRYRQTAGDSGDEMAGEVWLQQRSAELYALANRIPVTDQKDAATILTDFAAREDGAQLTDWNKSRITTGTFLKRIAQEHAASKAAGSNQMSEPVKSFLSAYRLNTIADIDAFIAAQSKLPERN